VDLYLSGTFVVCSLRGVQVYEIDASSPDSLRDYASRDGQARNGIECGSTIASASEARPIQNYFSPDKLLL
jgi:hypothetical protein